VAQKKKAEAAAAAPKLTEEELRAIEEEKLTNELDDLRVRAAASQAHRLASAAAIAAPQATHVLILAPRNHRGVGTYHATRNEQTRKLARALSPAFAFRCCRHARCCPAAAAAALAP
jgi:hypothetical protein